MLDLCLEATERRRAEQKRRKANRWNELQVVCDVLNASKLRQYALHRALERYNDMIVRHDMEKSLFLHEVQDGGRGTFKNRALGRVGISRRIGRALCALIEHGSAHIKTCRCGVTFVAKRSTRKHCSENCKQSARLTNEYKQQKAGYMRDYRKTLKEMSKKPIRIAKKRSEL